MPALKKSFNSINQNEDLRQSSRPIKRTSLLLLEKAYLLSRLHRLNEEYNYWLNPTVSSCIAIDIVLIPLSQFEFPEGRDTYMLACQNTMFYTGVLKEDCLLHILDTDVFHLVSSISAFFYPSCS